MTAVCTVTVALVHVEQGADDEAFTSALSASGAVALEEWEPGCVELVEEVDGAGRRLALLGGLSSSAALSLATRAAGGGRASVLIATTRVSFRGGTLAMSTSLRAYEVVAGALRDVPTPPLDPSALEYEDPEPRPFSMSGEDLAEAGTELSSDVLHEARSTWPLPFAAVSSRRRTHHRLAASALSPRLTALVDAIRAGAAHREEPLPDGRVRLEVTAPSGKQISFLSASEHEQLRAALAG